MFALLAGSRTGNQRELSIGRADAARPRFVRKPGEQTAVAAGATHHLLQHPRGRRIAPRADSGPLLARALNPGETFTKEYRFDIPRDKQYPMVWITEGGWVTRFLTARGNNFLHRKEVTLLP